MEKRMNPGTSIPEDGSNAGSERLETAPAGLIQAHFDRLLSAIYEGPFERPPWSTALTCIQQDLQASWAALILRPATVNQPALILGARLGSVFVADHSPYASYTQFSLDPFVNLPPDRVVTADEFLGRDQWHQSEFYVRFAKPRGIAYSLGADVHTRNGIECRFRICRSEGGNPFSENDRAYCRALLPHLRRAVYIHSRFESIESERKLFISAVDGLRVGTVILDENGNVIKTNHAADEFFADKDGLRLVQGQIACDNAAENRELQKAIKHCLSIPFGAPPMAAEAVAVTRKSSRARLGLLIRSVPLSEWSEGQHRPAVAIFIRDWERSAQPSHTTIMQLFDLTPAEATLALALANGATLDEASEQMNIRRNTARAHLRSIFAKVGVTRQTMLVRVILNSVASMNDPQEEHEYL
jgi:DNA-binding CsgD family transcriptional regulator